jgi:hypothetical protein
MTKIEAEIRKIIARLDALEASVAEKGRETSYNTARIRESISEISLKSEELQGSLAALTVNPTPIGE